MCKPAAFIALIFLKVHWPTLGQKSPEQRSSPFKLKPKKEFVLIGSGLAIAGLDLILDHNVAPLTPNEVELLDPTSISRFDRAATK